MSNLKDKFNAAAEAASAKAEEHKAAHEKHTKTVLREYPRLCNELLVRVKALVGDANGVTISAKPTPEQLRLEGTTPPIDYGRVSVPVIEVKFLDRSITFTPAGVGYVGAFGAIEVEVRPRKNPLPGKGKIMMGRASKDSTDTWALVVTQEQFGRPVHAPLTDEILSEAIEKALL